jgi:putative heme iron utilization protein
VFGFIMNDTADLSKRAQALQELLASQQTLLLSTASTIGIPGISYAPFVRDGSGCFYVFISELAAHTDNLFTNPRASVMFVHPESESSNLFARERAIFDCSVKEVDRTEDCYSIQLKAMQDQFGEIVGILRSLSDFHLFALTPKSGRYIAGFGQAYTIDIKDGELSLLRKSHKKSN